MEVSASVAKKVQSTVSIHGTRRIRGSKVTVQAVCLIRS